MLYLSGLVGYVVKYVEGVAYKKILYCLLVLGIFVIIVYICLYYLSRHVGKPTICIGENKDADQLRGNREADQRLCFRYTDSTLLLLP